MRSCPDLVKKQARIYGSFGVSQTPKEYTSREVINIGRILVIEFKDQESAIFDKVMDLLRQHSDFQVLYSDADMVISIPGLDIYPEQRKIYRDRCEIDLTTKEYDLLYLLVLNKGHVITYDQIYQNVWGEESLGNANNAVKCHIRNLRDKLYVTIPDAPFVIRCIREVGYCLDVKSA